MVNTELDYDIQTGRNVYVNRDLYESNESYKTRIDSYVNEGFALVFGTPDNPSSGGGENPNYVQVITGTADNPWGTVDLETLVNALRNNDATATLYVQNGALGIDVNLSLDANRSTGYIYGYYGFVNGDGSYGVYEGCWRLSAGTGSHMLVSSTNTGFVDGSQYMPVLNTRLTIIWHPLP